MSVVYRPTIKRNIKLDKSKFNSLEEYKREYSRVYRKLCKSKTEIKLYNKEYYDKNRERLCENQRRYDSRKRKERIDRDLEINWINKYGNVMGEYLDMINRY